MQPGVSSGSGDRATRVIHIATILFVIGCVFHVISMSTPYWIKGDKDSYSGLWYGCVKRFKKFCDYIVNKNTPGWFKAVESFSVLALAGCVFGLVSVFLHMRKRDRKLLLVTAVCTSSAGVFAFLTAIVFRVKEDDFRQYLGWSFDLEWVAGVLLILSGWAYLFSFRRVQYQSL